MQPAPEMNAAVRGAIVLNAERALSAVLGACMPSGGQMAGDRRVNGGQVADEAPNFVRGGVSLLIMIGIFMRCSKLRRL